MAISASPHEGHDAAMAPMSRSAVPGGARLLSLAAAKRRPLNRDDALRQVRSVRHHVQARPERFAHLKRVYD
jgi:hypothetical protein